MAKGINPLVRLKSTVDCSERDLLKKKYLDIFYPPFFFFLDLGYLRIRFEVLKPMEVTSIVADVFSILRFFEMEIPPPSQAVWYQFKSSN